MQATWFAMLHSDVAPEAGWIDKLIEEAERQNADILSVVIPLKEESGLTSTAISHPTEACRTFCRLTMSQVRHAEFPRTFDLEMACKALESLPGPVRIEKVPRTQLLCNTGCVVCRLDRPWCDPRIVCFDDTNTIGRSPNHQWWALTKSEDWMFTSRAAANGAKVMATTAVKVVHHGAAAYANDRIWGAATGVTAGVS
jgi:hypothetical protein